MDETLYFHVALEPHLKHSGSITGRRILFLAEVPVDAAKKTATNPDDDDELRQVAQRLAAELLPIAMTGHREVGGGRCHATDLPCNPEAFRRPSWT